MGSAAEPEVQISPSARAAPVPVAAGRVVPSRFVARIDLPGAAILGLDIRVTERGAEIVRLALEARDWLAPGGITASELRSVRVRESLQRALRAAARPITWREGDWFRIEDDSADERRHSYAVTFDGGRDPSNGRGQRVTRPELERAAGLYRQALALGKRDPTATVARALPKSRSTAARWIMRARREGLLGPAVGPTPGETVTQQQSRQRGAWLPRLIVEVAPDGSEQRA